MKEREMTAEELRVRLKELYAKKGAILRRVEKIKIPHVRTDRGFRPSRASKNGTGEGGFAFWSSAQIVVLVLATLIPVIGGGGEGVSEFRSGDGFDHLRAWAIDLRDV